MFITLKTITLKVYWIFSASGQIIHGYKKGIAVFSLGERLWDYTKENGRIKKEERSPRREKAESEQGGEVKVMGKEEEG